VEYVLLINYKDMKRIIALVAICLLSFTSFLSHGQQYTQKLTTFTITDSFGVVKQYVVNAKFLEDFAMWSRNNVPQQYRIWYSDMYRAMSNGTSIVYDKDKNTIAGMYGLWHVKDTNLSTGQSRFRKSVQATFNLVPHQFRIAMSYLSDFYVFQPSTSLFK